MQLDKLSAIVGREPVLQAELSYKAWQEMKHFSAGAFHGAVENPVNGVIQIADRAGAHLPEVHLVDEKKVQATLAGRLGNVAGITADAAIMTVAMTGLGGAGPLNAAAKLAAVGATLGGVLTPSDAHSKTFAKDRLEQAAVGGVIGGALGAAGYYLDGWIGGAGVRSLVEGVALGASSAIARGATTPDVHSRSIAAQNQENLQSEATKRKHA